MTFPSGLLSCVAAHALLYAALMTPPSALTHRQAAALFLPAILGCNVYAWQRGLGPAGSLQAFWSAHLLLWRRPREDFRLKVQKRATRRRDDGGGAGDASARALNDEPRPYPDALLERFWWVTRLVASPRHVGWDTGAGDDDVRAAAGGDLPSAPAAGRGPGPWVRKKCVWIALWMLAVDATNCYMLWDAYFLGPVDFDIDSPLPERVTTALLGSSSSSSSSSSSVAWLSFIPPRLPRILVFGLQQYAVFSLLGDVFAIIWVSLAAIGLADDFWGGTHHPSLMGSPLAILQRGLRGFWGSFWHQLFRHIFADPGRELARALNIPKSSTYYYAVQGGVAFFLSGVFHAATLPRGVEDVSMLRYASFFWIQGLCVLVEILVSSVVRPSHVSRARPWWLNIRPMVRLVWTIGVMYATAPVLVDELVKMSLKMGTRPVLLFPVPHNVEPL